MILIAFFLQLIFKHLNNRNGSKTQTLMEKFTQNQSHYLPNLSPPPPYASLFTRTKHQFMSNESSDLTSHPRKYINGRDYLVVKNVNGESRLIPIRTPSAAIFQYSYTN